MYHQAPLGQHVIHVCTSISCYLCGCDDLLARLENRLGIARGETSADGRFTLKGVECLAACGMAPVLQVNGDFVEHVTPERAELLIQRLERGAGVGDLASRWRPMGNGGYTSADGIALESVTAEDVVPTADDGGPEERHERQSNGSRGSAGRGKGKRGGTGGTTEPETKREGAS
jgi:(2Fe-2S) ferredoxin